MQVWAVEWKRAVQRNCPHRDRPSALTAAKPTLLWQVGSVLSPVGSEMFYWRWTAGGKPSIASKQKICVGLLQPISTRRRTLTEMGKVLVEPEKNFYFQFAKNKTKPKSTKQICEEKQLFQLLLLQEGIKWQITWRNGERALGGVHWGWDALYYLSSEVGTGNNQAGFGQKQFFFS